MNRRPFRRAVPFVLASLLATSPTWAQTYAVDFVATAAQGTAMNTAGTVIAGFVSLPPACATCPPTFNLPAFWSNGRRFLIDLPPGAGFLTFAGISAQGWVAGTAMRLDATGGPGYVWLPRSDGSAFDAQAIGTLPGLDDAIVAGIDDQNRIFGRASTWNVGQAPFTWSAATGMQDLRALGYPEEPPVAVSPGGTLATTSLTYRYGDPASVSAVTPPPAGFFPMSSALTGGVNDAGMRASFLLSTSGTSSGYRYLARHTDAAGWQVLGGPVVGGNPFGVGSVDPSGAITATLVFDGVRAAGPAGVLQTLTSQLSTAYPEAAVTYGGDQAQDDSVLAQVIIGRSPRLAKLVPVQPCTSNCLRVAGLSITGRMISAPGRPGQCVDGASNRVSARVTVVDDAGQPVPGATVQGRFLDDDYLDAPVNLRTNRRGQILAKHTGPACVGAVAFLVDRVVKAGSQFDRNTGVLTAYVIPQPRR